MIFNFLLIFEHCNQRKIYLLCSIAIGFFGSVIYIFYAPKIYEVTTFLNLPYSNVTIENNTIQKNSIFIYPYPNDVQKIFSNPLNINNEMLAACSMDSTNENRKKLVNSIYITSLDKNDLSILLRVRLEGRQQSILCAQGLIEILARDLNNVKDRYIQTKELNGTKGLININSKNYKIQN